MRVSRFGVTQIMFIQNDGNKMKVTQLRLTKKRITQIRATQMRISR